MQLCILDHKSVLITPEDFNPCCKALCKFESMMWYLFEKRYTSLCQIGLYEYANIDAIIILDAYAIEMDTSTRPYACNQFHI